MGKKYKVVMVQRNYPHYRRAIFQKLATHPLLDFTLLHGSQSGFGEIVNVENDPVVKCITEPINYIPFTAKRFCTIPSMSKYVKDGDYDVLIVPNDLYCLNLLPDIKTAYKRGKKVCIFSIGFPQYKQPIRDKIRVWLAHKVDSMILYSYAHRQRFIKNGVPGEKIFVAPNAVDVESVKKAEAQMTQESLNDFKVKNGLENHRVLIHAGRMVDIKELDILIKAAVEIKKKITNLKIVFLGEGPMTEPWKKLAEQLGVADVFLWPGTVVDHDKLCYWFHSSDICVAPAQQGLISNLSHSYGIPLITSDCETLQGPEIQVFTNGKTGLLYKYRDVNDLSDKICDLLLNDEKRLEMGRQARKVIFESFTIDKMCQGFIDGIEYAVNH